MAKKTCLSETAQAAALIRAGELVAFPTETVYGLGANAFDAAAVARVFAAKGRPITSPLIVHVDSVDMARRIVREWPDSAERLAGRFWPGPLTLVLPKTAQIPDRVTAGLRAVGIRMPRHPLALALIREAGVPIAAPSANRFSELSPTTAEHVRASLGDRVAMVLDGGPTSVGIESAVLSLDGPPALLRPGTITQASIEELIGPVIVRAAAPGAAHPAPGMRARHYSPRTPFFVAKDGRLPERGRGVYLSIARPAQAAHSVQMPADAPGYAAALYAVLHRLDAQGWDWIAAEAPPAHPEWTAIADRLTRAAQP